MGGISTVKSVIQAFRGIENKKEVFKSAINTVQKGGISELKNAAKRAYNRGGEMELVDLYELQQSNPKEYEETGIKVLFIILVEQTDAYIADTYESIRKLINIEKEVVVLAIEGFHWDYDADLYTYKDAWNKNLNEIIINSRADYVYFIRGGCSLAPDMGGAFFNEVKKHPFRIIYSDECIQLEKERQYILKPDFSRFDLLYNQRIGQSVAFFREAILESGEMNDRITRLDDLIYDLFLKLSDDEKSIRHVDQVLLIHKYSFKESVEWVRAINIKRELIKYGVQADALVHNGSIRIDAGEISDKISLIIPTESYVEVANSIDSILDHTRYISYDITVVSNREVCSALAEHYMNMKKLQFVETTKNSYSAKCNIGAKESEGDILLFLSDDVKIMQEDWLYKIGGIFAFPWVGGVSPKVIRNENTIRYAGMIAGGFGFTPIAFNGEINECNANKNEPAFYNRQVSILSATCLAVRRTAFNQINGFDEKEMPEKFSNAVLSFELMKNGWSCIYCAESTVVAGNKSWYDSWYDKEDASAYLYLLKNYGDFLTYDPYFTEEMKKQYLRGVPTGFRIYKKKIDCKKKGSILLVSHDALLGGATIVLQSAAKILKDNGYFVTFLVPEEGRILNELEAEGIDYIVDSSLYGNDEWMKYANNFDIIFLNTLLMGEKISKLQKFQKKIVWWIHEAQGYYRNLQKKDFVENNENLAVYCVGEYARSIFERNFSKLNSDILLYGLPDYWKEEWKEEKKTESDIIFLSIGTIEKRKGQDILCEAIESLEDDKRERCRFIFVGKGIHQDIYAKIEGISLRYPKQIEILPPVNRQRIMELYRECTAVICSSRDDPMPVFMTECMMMSKVPICSENTGTAKILSEGYNGFLYSNNSADELASKIRYVIEHKEEMGYIGVNARKTYEDIFSMERFEKNVLGIIEKKLSGNET